MRKISIICRSRRIIYPAIFAGVTWALVCAPSAFSEITPPVNPKPEPPPPPSSSGREEFQRKVQREMDESARQLSADKAREEEAAEDSAQAFLKSRPFAGFAELSFYAARASVTGGRSDYQVDPGIHTSAYLRTYWRSKVRDLQPWFGLRTAPFGGYGTQKGRTARYAHTWMGPALGIGKFLTPGDRDDTSAPAYLILLSGGFSGVARLTNPDETEKSPLADFKPCAWCQDGSGAWLEFRYTYLSSGVVGVSGLLGVQTGTGKVFSYGGVSIAGFY